MPKLPSLTIFFPFFNDAGTVSAAITQAFEVGSEITSDLEVIAIHGGPSHDHTWQNIRRAQKRFPQLKILNFHDNTEGYAVIKHGLAAATKDWVFYTDGDLQYDVRELKLLVQKQLLTNTDVVNGWKQRRHDLWWRRWAGEAYRILAKLLFGLPIRDVDCDFRLIRTRLLKKLKLEATNASILAELITKLHLEKAIFAELPVSHFNRRYGQSNYTLWQLTKEKIGGDLHLWWHLLTTQRKKSAR